MGRIEAEHEPIEEPPAAARALEKEAIHRRGQPHYAEPLAQHRLASRRLAVDAHDPSLARRPTGRPPGHLVPGVKTLVATGSDVQGAAARRDDRGDSPAPARASGVSPLPAIDFGQFRPAQPAARRKEGYGL